MPTTNHLPEPELNRRLQEAASQVTVGARYAHYKNPTTAAYLVTGLAIMEDTDEVAVIYQAEYGAHLTFIRPLTVWIETVEHDGRPVPRFSRFNA